MVYLNVILFILFIQNLQHFVVSSNLIVYLSQHGLHGEIMFRQINKTTVEIKSNLETTLQYPDQIWSWEVREFPVDYTIIDSTKRCHDSLLGRQMLSFDSDLEYLLLPGNETSIWYREMELLGHKGVWSRSLLLTEISRNVRVCATITTINLSEEHIAEAKFNSPIAGSIYFRWLAPTEQDSGDISIYSNLYHVKQQTQVSEWSHHNWKIYVSDIFKNKNHHLNEDCNFLQVVLDPQGYGTDKGVGDLDSRLGKLKISKNVLNSPQRMMFRDDQLTLLPSDLTVPHRTLFLVVFDDQHPDSFLACTQIRHTDSLLYKAFVNSHGIKTEVTISQRSKFDPTFLNITSYTADKNSSQSLSRFAEDVAAFKINSLPPTPHKLGTVDYCRSTAGLLDPMKVENEVVPPPGYGTQEQYALGDISGKLQQRNKQYYHNYQIPSGSSELNGLYWDVFLPLQGAHSILYRSIVIYKYDRSDPQNIKQTVWGCAPLTSYVKTGAYQKDMTTAQVLFRYPIVGRVLFRQPAEEFWQDTTIIFEYLIHADGAALNNTFGHRWAIHEHAPGKDFYDWQNRCASTGDIYNPYKIHWENSTDHTSCNKQFEDTCRVGAMSDRLGEINIAGSRKNSEKISRQIFVDSNLPLSGRHSIFGKALVIYDDFGPKARGERLACSVLLNHPRRKVVAKDWFGNGNGGSLSLMGKIEIVQQSEYEMSNIEIQFKGLRDNSGYQVHMTPVEGNLAFPCEASTLYGHWNPLHINPKNSPPPSTGTSDQYEIGDLSGKFGQLNSLTHFEGNFNDSHLPIFGLNSITGRSVVIHNKDRKTRWACSTLERGYSPSEARELRAIASFHHPTGFAYGYIKMTQLVHNDGSQSDTIIEIKLSHPGKNDRNVTRHHNWQIFVNPVGVDAAVKTTNTRCVAGGYVWNPFYTQLADPLNRELYEQECAPDNPLRCYVGDVGSRLGTIDLGVDRVVLIDSNLPLASPVGAIGRSVVIFGPEHSSERFACANIAEDHNVIKYINLQKPPRFIVSQFLEELRDVMGVPEWMLDVDSRKTKELHDSSCIQMIIHFRGPIAHQLEKDMSSLLGAGRLEAPSLFIPGYNNQKRKKKISYRPCNSRDPLDKREKTSKKTLFTSSGGLKPEFTLLKTFVISVLFIYKFFVIK